MFSPLARCSLVASISDVGGGGNPSPSGTNVSRRTGALATCSQVEHLLCHPQLLVSKARKGGGLLPGRGALKVLHLAEVALDIPLRVRLEWLDRLKVCCPSLTAKVTLSQRRLRRSLARAKYDLFFDPSPLVAFYRSGSLASLPLVSLRDKMIIALRVHTLGRSADLAQLLPNLWSHQGMLSCRFFDKTGRHRMLTLSGRPLALVLVYLAHVSSHPAPFLIRYQKDFRRCLGSEAVAKAALKVMESCGIDTTVFKAHSVRGAAATAFLASGIDQALTRQRGGWSDTKAFEAHYARLHQLIRWDDCFSAEPVRLTAPQPPFQGPGGVCSPSVGAGKSCLSEPKGQTASSPSASAAKAKSSVPEPTKEGEGKEDEQKAAEALGLLNVRQLVRPLGGGRECPACSARLLYEAAYVCSRCQLLVHVRCLQVENLFPPNASSQMGPIYSSACVRCQPECVSTVEPNLDFGSPGLPLTTVPESAVLDSELVDPCW